MEGVEGGVQMAERDHALQDNMLFNLPLRQGAAAAADRIARDRMRYMDGGPFARQQHRRDRDRELFVSNYNWFRIPNFLFVMSLHYIY